MKGFSNESTVDRIIRVVLGIVLVYLGLGGMTAGTLAVILAIVGVVLLITGIIGWCPLYAVLGLRTNRA